jgi:hypothetical protein
MSRSYQSNGPIDPGKHGNRSQCAAFDIAISKADRSSAGSEFEQQLSIASENGWRLQIYPILSNEVIIVAANTTQ